MGGVRCWMRYAVRQPQREAIVFGDEPAFHLRRPKEHSLLREKRRTEREGCG